VKVGKIKGIKTALRLSFSASPPQPLLHTSMPWKESGGGGGGVFIIRRTG